MRLLFLLLMFRQGEFKCVTLAHVCEHVTHHLIDIQDYPPGEPQLDDNFIYVQAEILPRKSLSNLEN